jgi:hypothetical protein
MTRTISLIIGIAVVALVAIPTAFGEGRLAGSPEQEGVAYFYANERATLGGRPATSYYTPQVLQRMSDGWAARGGVLTNVPASSYYLPQQIETMSQGWAARGGLLPASANVATESPAPTGSGRDVEWPQIGIGFGIGIVLAIVLGLTIKATRPRTFAH